MRRVFVLSYWFLENINLDLVKNYSLHLYTAVVDSFPSIYRTNVRD